MTSSSSTQSIYTANSAGDLAFAFGSLTISKAKTGKKSKSHVASSAAEIDLREFSQSDRELLPVDLAPSSAWAMSQSLVFRVYCSL